MGNLGEPSEELERVPPPADDISAELAAHLEISSAALVREGMSPDDARAEALRRFGDPGRHLDACWRQTPQARVKRGLAFALCGVTAVSVAGMAWLGLHVAGQRVQIKELSAELAAVTFPRSAGVVFIDGEAVRRPGVYSLPREGALTVSRLLLAAGAPAGRARWAYICRPKGANFEFEEWVDAHAGKWQSPTALVLAVPLPTVGAPFALDPVLHPNDTVILSAASEAAPPNMQPYPASTE